MAIQLDIKRKNLNTLSDLELWRAYHEGDSRAYGVLFKRHELKLFLVINSWVKDPELAKDILQEVTVKILEKGESTAEIVVENFFVWAVQFARNIWRSGHRNTKRRAEIIHDEVSPYIQTTCRNEAHEDLTRMVDCLKRVKKLAHRRILVLAAQGYKNPEIAVRLKKSTKWVKDNRCLAKKEFRQILEREGLMS
ncbi:MAG: sigma-70 family RNA polymerase sigma factor [Bacteroidota bacterium]